ncbi:MAG: hypothetical protein GTO18_13845 [Anaerolineales bacterium]|nr:hypothetical protein [Anaerolineales bacterium]
MNDPMLYVQRYKRAQRMISNQTEGLTHHDSLLQLPFRGNCMNWVLGHIMVYRDLVLQMLGEETLLDEREKSLYKKESEPITDEETAVPLERLLSVLQESEERLVTALEEVTSEGWEANAEQGDEYSVGEWIEFLEWHENYHVGQLEILRQLAGKDDAII